MILLKNKTGINRTETLQPHRRRWFNFPNTLDFFFKRRQYLMSFLHQTMHLSSYWRQKRKVVDCFLSCSDSKMIVVYCFVYMTSLQQIVVTSSERQSIVWRQNKDQSECLGLLKFLRIQSNGKYWHIWDPCLSICMNLGRICYYCVKGQFYNS